MFILQEIRTFGGVPGHTLTVRTGEGFPIPGLTKCFRHEGSSRLPKGRRV